MMYRYIEQRLEQRDFSVTDAIHLFEKVDQKNATQDDLDEFEILSRDIYYLCQKQLKLDYRYLNYLNGLSLKVMTVGLHRNLFKFLFYCD